MKSLIPSGFSRRAVRGLTTLIAAALALPLLTLAGCSGSGLFGLGEDPPPPPPRVIAPTLAPFFGINGAGAFHEAKDPAVWSNLQTNLRRARSLGAHSIRLDFWWGVIEPKPGEFRWEFPDRVISEIVAAGLEPLPILCYTSAWDKNSPATPEERERWGRYVRACVDRYKGFVKCWEVWNEPNIPPYWTPGPNPVDYTELLKITHREAKAADPGCTLVGFALSFPDYAFLEACFEHGAADYFDVFSWHAYQDRRDEAEFEEDMRKLRRFLATHGAGNRPIWVTETGIITGPSDLMAPSTEPDQGVWLAKRMLVAISTGLDRYYYFCLRDWYPGAKAEGQWGLDRHDQTPKPAAGVYERLARRIGAAQYVGRAYETAVDAARADDAQVLLFESEAEGLFAAAWVRRDGPPLKVRLPADAPLRVVNLDGVAAASIAPLPSGEAEIVLSSVPVFIGPLPSRARPLGATRISPSPLYIAPGETREMTLTVENPGAAPFDASFAELLRAPSSGGLKITAPGYTTRVKPGETVRLPLRVEYPANGPTFVSQRFRLRDPAGYSFEFAAYHTDAFSVDLQPPWPGDGLRSRARVRNLLDHPQAGVVRWRWNGQVTGGVEPFLALDPGADIRMDHLVPVEPGEGTLAAEAVIEEGSGAVSRLKFWGIPRHDTAPLPGIGDGPDWPAAWRAIAPGVRLAPSRNQSTPPREKVKLDDARLTASIHLAWTPDSLLVYADVTDVTPMLNPYRGPETWRGDAIEFYLGFEGPTRAQSYGPKHFQIGLNPGDETNPPFVWNWRTPGQVGAVMTPGGSEIAGAVIASRKTTTGYLVAAEIPFEALGVKPEPGMVIGFDCALDNKDTVKSESNDAVLMWNGGPRNWRDPSGWGVGVLLAR